MLEKILHKNYARAFKTVVILAIALALVSAVVIPLSLSQQLRDAAALVQEVAPAEHHDEALEHLWESRITPLTAAHYAILGGDAVLWLALLVYYWLLTAAWLCRSAVNEGMNKSLWPILGLLCNLLAVFAFLIVRDRPGRVRHAGT